MKLGAFIITFNRPAILKETVQLILKQTRPPDFVLVVDNGNSGETKLGIEELANKNVLYQAMGKNLGPAGAAAYALAWLSEREYDWIYWGDDDDPPQSVDTLDRLLGITELNHTDVGGVGAVGNWWDWDRGSFKRLPDQALHGIIDVDTIAGSSQFILRRQAVQAVGLPDARLFFGFEEPEYCLRIRKAGYRFLVDGDLMYEYRARAGRLNLKQQHSLLPGYPYHSIWRRYYATRNYIFLMNNTFQRPDLARREVIKAFGRVCTAWARGPRYGATFTALQLRGVLDGYLGRMGQAVLPKPKKEFKEIGKNTFKGTD